MKHGKEHGAFKDRTGEKYTTNEGYEIEIIEYFNKNNCTIEFDEGTILKNIQLSNITAGGVKNPLKRTAFGIGYLGIGEYKVKYKGRTRKEYYLWRSMLERCYKRDRTIRNMTYSDIIVCDEWCNFQNFAKWFENNYVEKFELDKDILCPDCKVYSPENCCFIPQEINKLFNTSGKTRGIYPIGVTKSPTGKFIAKISILGERLHLGSYNTPEEAFQAYKISKEKHIKEVADKWKHIIKLEIYEAMYNYKVGITD